MSDEWYLPRPQLTGREETLVARKRRDRRRDFITLVVAGDGRDSKHERGGLERGV